MLDMIFADYDQLKGMTIIEDQYKVLSLIKAHQLLDIISLEGLIGLSDLSRKSGLNKTTVFRLLETFKMIGLIDQDKSTQQYFLTIQVVTLASRVLKNLDLRRLSHPFMVHFVQNYGKTVLLSVLNNDQVVSVDSVKGTETLRLNNSIGDVQQVHCTASGKAILAYLPLEKCRSMLGKDPFTAYTSSTITDWLTLEQDLNAVRQRGYSLDLNERYKEIVGVGVPILNHEGKAIGAIAIPLIINISVDIAELTDLGNKLIELGKEISIRLGWTGIVCTDKNL